MKLQGVSFDGKKHGSRMETILRCGPQCGRVFSMSLAGCLYLSAMHGAAALPELPAFPAPVVVSSVSALPHEIYYYRGRYYPYRYHGAYYGHRYYRYGRWHYY